MATTAIMWGDFFYRRFKAEKEDREFVAVREQRDALQEECDRYRSRQPAEE